jgi:transposase
VLAAAEGLANRVIARNLSRSVPTVLLWRKRYEKGGVAGVLEDQRRNDCCARRWIGRICMS